MSFGVDNIGKNLGDVRERIERVATSVGRKAQEITLVAVSKTHSAAQIQEMYEAGVKHFGENRIQEWELKRGSLANFDATLHMIGHLQSNKVARAVRGFNTIDSVDTVALLERLDRAKKDFNTEDTEERGESSARMRLGKLRVLIEVKLDTMPSKTGASEEELQRLVESAVRFPHLELAGLMGVPPYFEDAEQARPYFRRLRELRDNIRAQIGRELLPVLSMGMSHDFEVAIEEGATEVRVGTALFGERKKE